MGDVQFFRYEPGLVTYTQSGGDTFVQADTGEGVLAVRLTGVINLAANDFIL